MDILTILGVIIGFGAILGGNFMDGGHLSALINGPAALIVLGGTIGAVLLQSPAKIFFGSLKLLSWVLFPPELKLKQSITKIIEWSEIARREGLLGLEAVVDDEEDEFAKKGMQLLVDGAEPEVIRDILMLELEALEERQLLSAKVFESMGSYAPTIGIIGAVMGLIHVMQNLSDPSKLGAGIATAFVATIYGVGLANLLFIPMASKLKVQIQAYSQSREMMIEGIAAIAEGENPRNVEIKLQGYL
ncbi:MAG: flagellar motor protein [Cycloclasticus pugetii]|uniref:flagellar motor protein n=1 Tax=Cycloclasticus TaxID=34067 RepID=UPI000286ADF0|nr:flagellar motor protein [Cycloclasticus sp. P1]AFT67567.1 chemotaxis transmembrane proton channel [Cycloclasticus sp. P1]